MADRSLHILLVDDDEVDVMNVRRALQRNQERGLAVATLHVAGDGVEALELLRAGAIPAHRRLVLLDLNMPRMNGLELLRALRANPDLAALPVVVLTTSDDENDKLDAYGLNAGRLPGEVGRPREHGRPHGRAGDVLDGGRGAVTAPVAEPLRLLLVDDDEIDRRAVRRALAQGGLAVELTEIAAADDALVALRSGGFDCALFDYHIPGRDGLWLLRAARAAGIDTPVVMLTGRGDEDTAVTTMKSGAADYLAKSSLSSDRLVAAIRAAIRVHLAERDAAHALEALAHGEERLRIALHATELGIWDYHPATGANRGRRARQGALRPGRRSTDELRAVPVPPRAGRPRADPRRDRARPRIPRWRATATSSTGCAARATARRAG